jgi:uncharacterized protein YfdQ (DUF2303 family)
MSFEDDDESRENLAATLAKVLPKPELIAVGVTANETINDHAAIEYIALPPGHTIQAIDHESLLSGPRRPKLTIDFADAESFVNYVNYHAQGSDRSTVWCTFDPAKSALSFNAVLDEHAVTGARWRGMRASYTPRTSHEWNVWKANDRQQKDQVPFAEFLEENERDIAAGEKLPTSLDMLKMATDFEAHAEKRLKSVVKLQGGGLSLEYVNTDDAATIEKMKVFERFQIALPVFWTMPSDDPVAAYPVLARLKYRQNAGAVKFWYELIRPDLVYQTAALKLIEQISSGLVSVPLLIGKAD